MTTRSKPLIAITMGDPSGIGPEIALKISQRRDVFEICRPLIIGDLRILERARQFTGLHHVGLNLVVDAQDALYAAAALSLLDLQNADPSNCPPGQVSAISGKASVEYIFRACDLALAQQVDAIVTGPINKEAINLAGFHYAGHTELLAERTKAERYSMLLVAEKLRIVHVSTHVALEEAIRRVTTARVLEVIELARQSCLDLGIDGPRIAVAGLNPHAGEHGLFGDQEAREIEPAIEIARQRGWSVSAPQPPDTVFMRAVKGEYDIVVAMYHDQGHIPMKLLAFDTGVNVTIGLPIIRTSVDHGTAFDIAGTGQASETSLVQAIAVAVQMVNARQVK